MILLKVGVSGVAPTRGQLIHLGVTAAPVMTIPSEARVFSMHYKSSAAPELVHQRSADIFSKAAGAHVIRSLPLLTYFLPLSSV